MNETCAHLLFPVTRLEPAGWCEEDREPHSEYCALHRPIDVDDYADRLRDEMGDR